MHKEDNHRGINSLRNYVSEKGYYVEGITFLSNYILKSCVICLAKSSSVKLKREPPKQIIINYPKNRYVMDLAELYLEFQKIKKLYLSCIIDHFSKYGIA